MNIREEISATLRARNTLLWVVTPEESRAERAIIEAAASAQYECWFWDCATGMSDAEGKSRNNERDPQSAISFVRTTPSRRVYVLRDLHKWMDAVTLRLLRTTGRELAAQPRDSARAILVLSPSGDIPMELRDEVRRLDFPLPTRAEVAGVLDGSLKAIADPKLRSSALPVDLRDAAIDAAVGLTERQASACYGRSLVVTKRIDVRLVSEEKKRAIAGIPGLSWIDPEPRGLDAIGGLDLIKSWLKQRRVALSKAARDFGLPAPKGLFVFGPPGTGKSLVAKCVPTAWEINMLRLDLGGLQSKYVGESQQNIRQALAVAETIAPCVLWMDEIEKSLAGSSGPAGDGGVASDALGTLLSWMQERTAAVFVVATANKVEDLPPELLRKGRFDEFFFVDLPTRIERAEVLRATLAKYGRDVELDLSAVVGATHGFTGAELAALIPDALFAAFADGQRDITSDDLLTAAELVVPLSKTAGERIEALRAWARGRARPASLTEAVSNGRELEV